MPSCVSLSRAWGRIRDAMDWYASSSFSSVLILCLLSVSGAALVSYVGALKLGATPEALARTWRQASEGASILACLAILVCPVSLCMLRSQNRSRTTVSVFLIAVVLCIMVFGHALAEKSIDFAWPACIGLGVLTTCALFAGSTLMLIELVVHEHHISDASSVVG